MACVLRACEAGSTHRVRRRSGELRLASVGGVGYPCPHQSLKCSVNGAVSRRVLFARSVVQLFAAWQSRTSACGRVRLRHVSFATADLEAPKTPPACHAGPDSLPASPMSTENPATA